LEDRGKKANGFRKRIERKVGFCVWTERAMEGRKSSMEDHKICELLLPELIPSKTEVECREVFSLASWYGSLYLRAVKEKKI